MFRYVAAAALTSVSFGAQAETVVVTADRMVDVLQGRVVEQPVITIVDGRITRIDAGAATPAPEGAKRIDLPGKTILPGLIDMHVHLDSNPRYGGYTSLQFTDLFWPVQGVGNARDMLHAGFTTVRNVGSDGYSLARHGRSGVPLYLYYAPGEAPEMLPQILTPDGLIETVS